MKEKKLAPWKVLKSEYLVDNKWLKVRQDSVVSPGGKVIDDYFVTEFSNAVIVFALTEKNEVIFEKEYKHGTRQIQLGLPAGTYHEEAPLEVAKRELLEETGYRAKRIKHLGTLSEYATKNSHKLDVFVAEEVEYIGTNYSEDLELIEVLKIPLKKVEGLIKKNEIKAAGAVAAICMALLYLRGKKGFSRGG